MKLRAKIVALPFLIAAAVGSLAASSCGGDDDDSCDGKILTAPQDCNDCTCTGTQSATCTAFPAGDEGSNQRCCVCN